LQKKKKKDRKPNGRGISARSPKQRESFEKKNQQFIRRGTRC